MERGLTRRAVLRAGVAAGALAGVDALLPARVLERVLAAPAGCGTLADIEHVVIFINENRSFDSYFGTFHGVRGFGDPSVPRLRDGSGLPIFAQPFPGAAGVPYGGHLLPFRFDTNHQGECVNDITHAWAAQHQAWNAGAMDAFLSVHLQANGPRDGPNTMGYYARSDLPFYHALADAFTICDGYHCSVIGPTDPNRLYSVSGTIDPAGQHGGPILSTSSTRAERTGTLSWTTMPEQLAARGISWKVYASADGNFGDNVLTYFKAYQQSPQLAANAFSPTFPGTFQTDCAAGTLPQVSWVLAPLVQSEHPPAPVTYGEAAAAQILQALTSNPALWAKTALFITYDENGGFFDHVPPPTPPPGTPGEYLTVSPLPSDAGGIAGPVGLGFRVPLLVVSPFARGGFVFSDVSDHTSLLRFLETRFGAEVPNLSAWRRSVTVDLTGAFNFLAPDSSIPALPSPSLADTRVLASNCPRNAPDSGDESFPSVVGYPLPPPPQAMPGQEPGSPRRPSGVCRAARDERGIAGPGNPLGLPGTSGCKNARHFAFAITRPGGHRVLRVDVYVNGRRVKTVRASHGSSVGRIVLTGLPAGNFRLRVVAHIPGGHVVQTVRRYHGCHRAAPHTGHRRAGKGRSPNPRFTG
jgi:phospholipase C